jgi:hypothetical protein
MENFLQKRLQFRDGGSVQNIFNSHKAKIPEVGKGATELVKSNRYAYEVVEVSADKKPLCFNRMM